MTGGVFYRQVMRDRAWERGSDALHSTLVRQGPALEVDLRIGLQGAVFEPGDTVTPVRLASDLAECGVTVVEGASHGVHLSHPDAFADFVIKTVGPTLVG